jgi:hypothetical protein
MEVRAPVTLADVYFNAALKGKNPIALAEKLKFAHEFDVELKTVLESPDDPTKKIAALYLFVGKLFRLGHKDSRVMERTIMALCVYLYYYGGLERLRYTVIFSDKLFRLVKRFQSEVARRE